MKKPKVIKYGKYQIFLNAVKNGNGGFGAEALIKWKNGSILRAMPVSYGGDYPTKPEARAAAENMAKIAIDEKKYA